MPRILFYLVLSRIGSLGSWKYWKTIRFDCLGTWKYWKTIHFDNLGTWKYLNTDFGVFLQKRRAPQNDEDWSDFRAEISHMRPIQARKLKLIKQS